jgi:hypothetical protein
MVSRPHQKGCRACCRFDMKLDHKLRAVALTLHTACDFVLAFTSSAGSVSTGGDPEARALLSSLWGQKMHNRQLCLESELAAHVRTLILAVRCYKETQGFSSVCTASKAVCASVHHDSERSFVHAGCDLYISVVCG